MTELNDKRNFWRENRLYIILWAAAALLSVVYVLPPLNGDYITYDSSYQYCLTLNSLEEIWRLIPTDFSPPLYAILLKLWTMVFGESLAVMRAFALLPLCGMFFLAAFPIRRAFGGKASVMCTVFFAFSTANFYIVAQIRPTTLAYFFVTAAAIYSYLALFYDYKYAYICFTVFSVLSMYTHNVGMLSALAFYISAFFVALAQKKRRHIIKFLISGAVSAVCYIPWLFVVIQQFGNVQKNYWSNDTYSISRYYDWTIGTCFNDGNNGPLSVAVIPIAALIAIISLLSVKSNREKLKEIKTFSDVRGLVKNRFSEPAAKTIYVILLFAAPIIVFTLFCILVSPVVSVRYFYIFCGTAVMMIAAGFSQFSGKIGMAVLSALTAITCSLHAVNICSELENATFPEMIEYIRNSAENEEDIAFIHEHEWTLGIMMYYFPQAKHYIVDETWCVLTTYDAFPSEVINIGDCKNISEYEDEFFFFDRFAPDTEIVFYQEYSQDDNFITEDLGTYSTYNQNWRLIHVTTKD